MLLSLRFILRYIVLEYIIVVVCAISKWPFVILSPIEQKELDIFLQENLCTEWISPSKLSIAAPVFFIKKKDSSL